MTLRNRFVRLRGLWLTVAVLVLIVLLPATAVASHVVYVAAPNGTDDTAAIQSALNTCAAYGKSCTVQLAGGTYLTTQLIVHNFQGTFKGMGENATTIQALFLPVNWPDPLVQACNPNFTDCLWATLITFIDGSVTVSDLTININLVPAAQTYVQDGAPTEIVYAPLELTGKHLMNATVDRIAVTGQPDANNGWGTNIENGIHYSGEMARSKTPGDLYFLTGSYTVRNSYFNNTGVAVSEDGFVTSTQITIGGSPQTGNVMENDQAGIDLESSQKSFFEISYNNSAGASAGGWVVPYYWAYAASGPSQYWIHDNMFTTNGLGAPPDYWPDGFYFDDNPTSPWIQAGFWNNTVQLQGSLSEGIGAYNTKGTAIWNNSISGTDQYDGIGLWNSTLGSVVGNNLSGLTVDTTGLAKIYLDPSTTKDFVFCSSSSDTVLNQGTHNVVFGCGLEQTSLTKIAPTHSLAGRKLSIKAKPQLK